MNERKQELCDLRHRLILLAKEIRLRGDLARVWELLRGTIIELGREIAVISEEGGEDGR
jgi:hypothetical protein